MLCVLLPVLGVLFGQGFVLDYQKIFGILFLCRPREIETPSYDGFSIDDYNLVMHDSVGSVYCYGNPGVSQKFCFSILPFTLTSIKNDLDDYPRLYTSRFVVDSIILRLTTHSFPRPNCAITGIRVTANPRQASAMSLKCSDSVSSLACPSWLVRSSAFCFDWRY